MKVLKRSLKIKWRIQPSDPKIHVKGPFDKDFEKSKIASKCKKLLLNMF